MENYDNLTHDEEIGEVKVAKNKKLESLNKQIVLQEKMQKKNLNIVSCCNCGSILIHTSRQTQCLCWSCEKHICFNDCEDYYYEGMPEQNYLENEMDS